MTKCPVKQILVTTRNTQNKSLFFLTHIRHLRDFCLSPLLYVTAIIVKLRVNVLRALVALAFALCDADVEAAV